AVARGEIDVLVEPPDVDEHDVVLVEELLREVLVRATEIVEAVAPSAPVRAPLDQDSAVLLLRALDGRRDDRLGSGLLVVDRSGLLLLLRRRDRGILSRRDRRDEREQRD